jgi:hypothetical protein
MKWIFLSMISTLTLLGLAGSDAQASQIPWSYSFTTSPLFVNGTPSGSGTIQIIGSSKVNVDGSGEIFPATLNIVRPNASTSTTFNPTTWTSALTLSDASGVSKPLNFESTISGSFSPAGWKTLVIAPLQLASSTLPSGWSSVTEADGQKEYIWKSPSGNLYNLTPYIVTFGLDGASSFEDNITFGGINANVEVGTSATPEPSTLVLSCIGLGFAWLTLWCQRRRALATQLG